VPLRATFRDVFAVREFRALWLSEVLSVAGDRLALVALTLLVFDQTRNPLYTGVTYAAGYLPWVVGGLFLADVADRRPRRSVMVVCDVVRMVLVAVMVIPRMPWQALVVLLFATTMFAPPFESARASITPDILQGERYALGTAVIQTTFLACQVVGAVGAGVAVTLIGVRRSLVIDAATFALSGLLIGLGVRARPAVRPDSVRPSPLARLRDGFRLVFGDPYLRQLSLFWSAANFALTGYTALVVIFLVRVIGLSAGSVGLLTAVPGAGGIAGALLARRVTARYGTARGLLVATWAALPFALLIPLTGPGPRLAWYIVGVLIAYTGIAVGNIIIAAFRQSYSPPGMCGRVTATMRVIIFATSPAGALAAGGLASWLGIRTALWILLGLAVLSGLLLRTSALTAGRDLPDRPSPPGR